MESALRPAGQNAAEEESEPEDSIAMGAGVHDFLLQGSLDLPANFLLPIRSGSIQHNGFVTKRAFCHFTAPFASISAAIILLFRRGMSILPQRLTGRLS
jgi:hypothetical protein